MSFVAGRAIAWLAVGVLLGGGSALAQTGEQTPAQTDEQTPSRKESVEEVVITGSRIQRDPNLGSPAPVQTVSAEDIKLSGEVDLIDVLSDVPALLNSNSPITSQSFVGGAGVGQSTLDLRGLGAERTLVLIDGRRHVPGVAGSATVDIGSVPDALVERVEVLSGGASSVYGADAVTGVVNVVLKDNYEGLDLDFDLGQSGHGDAQTFSASGTWGTNFADDAGNITFSLSTQRREGIRYGDREFTRDNRRADDLSNPALRFQSGDISGDTPNFQRFYNLDTGRFPRGAVIPSAAAFAANFARQFPGETPNLTPAELALFDRAANAPTRTFLRQPTFSITSPAGVIAPGNLLDFEPLRPGVDSDGNGVDDCLESITGFGAGPNGAGGCYTIGDDGRVRPFRDGLITGAFNQFGGDGIANSYDQDSLIPEDDRKDFFFTGSYQLADSLRLFGEAKYATSVTEFGGAINTFYDLLTVRPDNPFIPDVLQPLADSTGGLFVTKDFTDLGPNVNKNTRRTMRFVGGLEGEFRNGWTYELAANFGRFEQETLARNSVIQDRFFSAVDVTADANGNPICRSDIDPTPPPATPFDIPAFTPGFFTFRPGDGQCRPINLLGGRNSLTPEAIAFVTERTKTDRDIKQYVLSAGLTGDIGDWFMLPGGAPAFAVGLEYRDEKSDTTFNGLDRGILPIDTELAPAGTPVSSLGLKQNSLLFDPATQLQNSGGSFDVREAYAEVSLPLLQDLPFVEQLTLDSAARTSKYSTVGSTFTFNYGAMYAPVSDVRFRWSLAEAVRAPNIGELFSPAQGAFFRPIDPCDQSEIDALKSSGDPRGAIREAACRADGIPEGYVDPLSARFPGTSSGNPDLLEETARTQTVGVILQPRFLEGLTLSVDFFDIEIEGAILAVAAQDIVNGCYDSGTFPANQFCALFSRNRDPNSAQFGGFTSLRQTQLNFAAIETDGMDFSVGYDFGIGDNLFSFNVSGTHIDELERFFDPLNPNAVNPGLGELRDPEWAGNLRLGFARGPLSLRWSTNYTDNQVLRGVEIETAKQTFGSVASSDETLVHSVSFTYDFMDRYQLVGGVNNLADERPFKTEEAFPVSPVGRFFFMGVSAKF